MASAQRRYVNLFTFGYFIDLKKTVGGKGQYLQLNIVTVLIKFFQY